MSGITRVSIPTNWEENCRGAAAETLWKLRPLSTYFKFMATPWVWGS